MFKTMAVFSMMLELPRCLCLVKRALKSTGSEEVMAQGLSLWSGLCECLSQGEVGRRECGRWGLIEKKKEGDSIPVGRSNDKNGVSEQRLPSASDIPNLGSRMLWCLEKCGVLRGYRDGEVSGPTTRQENQN